MCGGLCNWNYFHYLYSQLTCHTHTSEWGDYLKEIIFINVPVFHIFPCRHTSVTYRALTVRRFSMETASGCSSRQCPARLRTSSRRTTRWLWRTRWRGTRGSRRSTTPSRSTHSPSRTSTTSPLTSIQVHTILHFLKLCCTYIEEICNKSVKISARIWQIFIH